MDIKTKRLSKGLTQDALAELLNVTRSTVAMWESQASIPTSDKLPKLAKILGCTIDDLYGKE